MTTASDDGAKPETTETVRETVDRNGVVTTTVTRVTTTRTVAAHGVQMDRLPGLAVAAAFSIAAGVVHAGAIGIHAEHPTLARLFIVITVLQIGFGIVALLRPARWLAAVGGAINLGAAAAWLVSRLAGISWIDGLEVRERAQFADTTCALLGVVAGGLALSAALAGWHKAKAPNLSLAGLAAAALAVPALFSGATHEHTHADASAAGLESSDGHDHSHEETSTAAPTAAGGTVTLDAATAATLPETIAHTHNADGTSTVDAAALTDAGIAVTAPIDESQPHTHDDSGAAVAGATAAPVDESQPHTHDDATAADAATAAPVDESQPHTHDDATAADDSEAHAHEASAAPPVPYDPTLPIDLGGVPGVTPEQQARAENLVAITLLRLPQWSDFKVAEAAGFQSIGDAATGFEHYIHWDWINDDDTLDPDRPESLVYSPQPDGTKQLVSAMFMLPDTVPLDQVPDIGGALTQWHIHDNLCFTKDPVAPRVAGLTDGNGNCPSSLQKFRPAPMIHVWITPNVCGPFAALEGVGAGQVAEGETRNCDHAHGSTATLS